MIASRKLERLQTTANELQQYLPASGTAELDFMECNIRNENQVIIIKWLLYGLYLLYSVVYWHPLAMKVVIINKPTQNDL